MVRQGRPERLLDAAAVQGGAGHVGAAAGAAHPAAAQVPFDSIKGPAADSKKYENRILPVGIGPESLLSANRHTRYRGS